MWQLLADKRNDLFDLTAFQSLYNQVYSMYQVLTQEEEYLNEVRRDHKTTGGLRSGEGSQNTLAARVKLFEENARLDEIEESGEIVADMQLQDQMFKRFQKRQSR